MTGHHWIGITSEVKEFAPYISAHIKGVRAKNRVRERVGTDRDYGLITN